MPVGLFLPGPGPYNAHNPERGVPAVAAGPLDYEATVLADGPEIYWRLDDVAGTSATDSSGNVLHGTYENGYTLARTSLINDGTSVAFSGAADSDVFYSGASVAAFSTGTIECWVKSSSPGSSFRGIVGKPNAFMLFMNSGVLIAYDWGGAAIRNTAINIADGGVHHVVMSFQSGVGSGTEIYLDGVSVLTTTITIGDQTLNFRAASGGSGQETAATIDEVAVYDYVLSPAKVLAHYNAGLPSPADVQLNTAAAQSAATLALTTPLPAYQPYALSLGPSLYWALNATTGATDLSGNARNGTGGGGVTVGANATSPLNGGSASTDLDGSDDKVSSTYAPFTNGTTRTYTGWAWRDSATYADLFGGDGHATAAPRIYIDPGTTLQWQPDAGGGGALAFTSVWPGNGQWVHWALVFDESTDATWLYLNGVDAGSGYATAAYPATSGNFNLGYALTAGNPFDGKMAHVAVWERALTPTEIANLYASRLLPGIESLASAGQSAATLALSAPAKVTLATSAAQSAATLALTAPAKVTLATGAAVSSATLALSAPTRVSLATAACVASATCAVSIPSAAVEVPLATAACQSSATLALSAPALTTLQSSAAVSSATLALSAPAKLTLTAAATSSATLALRAETRVTLGTSAAQSAVTLALTAPTRVVLGTAATISAATLALSAPTRVVLGTSAAQSAATLSLTAPTRVTLGTTATQSSATLALTATTQVPLQTSAAVASATLGLTAGGAPVPLATAAAVSAATLSLKALTQIPLATSAATASATIVLTSGGPAMPLATATAQSAATFALAAATRVVLQTAAGISTASLSVVIFAPAPETHPELGGDVEEVLTGGEVSEVLTGGDVAEVLTGGVPVAHVTSGVVNEVLTGGTYDETLTGGEVDDTTGGDVREVLTGGVVNEVLTGGTYDETLTGGEIDDVPTGDSPDESETGGTYDEVLTGGEVY